MSANEYRLRVWGARGTVPTPSPDRLRFGGNTACLALELNGGDHLVLDCGSGLRNFGMTLDGAGHHFHVFLSHYHFDHIEGLPLFPPLYDAASRFTIHGMDCCGRSARQILESLVSPPHFPVTLAESPAEIEYRAVNGATFAIGDITVDSVPLNHPDGCMAFRLTRGERRIVYATDHEHGVDAIDRALIEFARDADTLIYDATYQPKEYEELRRGWGHSTWYAAVQTAMAADVGRLVLFHHHPDHTDDELAAVLDIARREFPETEVAHEGLELPL